MPGIPHTGIWTRRYHLVIISALSSRHYPRHLASLIITSCTRIRSHRGSCRLPAAPLTTPSPNLLSFCAAEGPSVCLYRLPSIARPYALDANWWDAFRQCLKRIVARLARVRISGVNGAGGAVRRRGALPWGGSTLLGHEAVG